MINDKVGSEEMEERKEGKMKRGQKTEVRSQK